MTTTDERTEMAEWVTLFATRDELAVEYAKLLHGWSATDPRWAILNGVIVDRWSDSALAYIKQKAWNQPGDPEYLGPTDTEIYGAGGGA